MLDFLIHLQDGRKLKANTLNQAVCALRTLYRDHLARDWDIWKKIKFKFEEPLPHVLTRDEVGRLLRTFRDGRYRAYCTVVSCPHCGGELTFLRDIAPVRIPRGPPRLKLAVPS